MKLTPRWYQQEAHDAVVDWVKGCIDPCLIEAATGAGKSIIIAMLAQTISGMSGKKILVLQPSAELTEQNHAKYLLTGEGASIFSASVGKKEMHRNVIFGTPGTVKNAVARFGANIAAVVVDECHSITPTIMGIIEHIRTKNANVRVVGLSATPYRLGDGYVYANDDNGTMGTDAAIEPYFHTKVYSIGARQLIDEGFLTPPSFDSHAEGYDTSGLTLNNRGQWDSNAVDQAFVGLGRKTSGIVADIVERSKNRMGVMIFASTVQHAKEVMESLPPTLSALVHGNTPKDERRKIIADFKDRRIKYLVNVSVLTTGFDAEHVDVIAILRATESVSLLQQIIGRGLRIHPDKNDCLVLDYAENIERHCPGGDVFAPDITARRSVKGEAMQIPCPLCTHVNEFGARKNDEGYGIDEDGYFTDLAGDRIEVADEKPLPAHYGRRCQGEALIAGKHTQCVYKWSFKECGECGAENDIAARHCSACKNELVDPNVKLQEEAARIASDPYRLRQAEVKDWTLRRWPGRDGKPDTLRVDFHIDESPHMVSKWLTPKIRVDWDKLTKGKASSVDQALQLELAKPEMVAYRKKSGSRFFDVVGFE